MVCFLWKIGLASGDPLERSWLNKQHDQVLGFPGSPINGKASKIQSLQTVDTAH